MNSAEIKCIARGILAVIMSEPDEKERDIRCLRAIMEDKIVLLVSIPFESEILITDLIENCYEGNIARMLAAEKHVNLMVGPFSRYQALMCEQLYEVSLKKLQQIAKPTIVDLNTACTIYLNINEEKRGSARSLLRRFVKEIGAIAPMDKFIYDLEATIEVQDAMLDVRDIIASALVEANGASEIWEFIRPAFREGYVSFNAWWDAEEIKAKLTVLANLVSTPQIVEIVKHLVTELNTKFKDPLGGERWFRDHPVRSLWYQNNIVKD